MGSNPRAGSSKYLLWLTVTIGLCLALIAVINVLQDPYGRFGTPRIKGVNNAFSSTLYSNSSPSELISRMRALAASTAAQTVVLGSSRSVLGFNTCNRPNIQKLGLFGIQESDALTISRDVIGNHKVQHYLIELDALNNVQHRAAQPITLFQALIGFHALQRSLSIAWDSVLHGEDMDYPNCMTLHTPKTPFIQVTDQQKQQYAYRKNIGHTNLNAISHAIETIDRLCQQRKNRLRITFYAPPAHPDLIPPTAINEFISQLDKKTINLSGSPTSCRYKFASYATMFDPPAGPYEMLRDASLWYDPNHFTPVLGQLFLEHILN